MAGRRLLTRAFSIVAVVAVLCGLLIALPSAAGASSGPFSSTTTTVHQTPHAICRANGGSISPNTEADQDLGFDMTYPKDVRQGDTFDIKIRGDWSGFPSKQSSATVYNSYNTENIYQLPAGLTINSAHLGPINGDVAANPEAGYYIDPANVPDVTSGGDTNVDPNFDPLSVPAAQRLSIPGIAPSAFWNTSTNRVYLAMLGDGSGGNGKAYRGGSVLQAPTLTINVTATASIGTRLGVKMAGQLPGSEPRNYFGSQPGNFSAPGSNGTLTQSAVAPPFGSTDGKTYALTGESTWSDPSYINTTQANLILTVTAKAYCAPGWEPTGTYPTAPSYYLGPNAIANGTSPALSDTVVYPYIDSTVPAEGGKYATGSTLNASYKCRFSATDFYDTCTGDVADGAAIDTSTPGAKTFTINGTDANGDPLSKTINYTIADVVAPVANAGAAQTGKTAGTVVTLNGSASSDSNGFLPLTYTDALGAHPTAANTFTWTQTSGTPVTLSDTHAISPTFTVPPQSNPSGESLGFQLTVDNSLLTNSASTTVGAVASTPSATVAKTRVGGGTTFTVGDTAQLSATITNPDGTNSADYTYNWTQVSGRTTTLNNPTSATPTFVIPSSGAAPTTTACTNGSTTPVSPTNANCPRFQVIVTKTNTAKSSNAAALAAYAGSLPTRPVANAGPAQNIANAGGTVTLNGSASTQAQGHAISYAWTQTAGPAVTLSDPSVASPTFTAAPGGSSGTTSTFSLVVTDTQSPITGSGTNGNTSTASTVNITVVPDHVVATASINPTSGVAGAAVTLTGSASTDPNNAPLSYTWTQVNNGAPTVTLSNPNAANPTFTAPAATTSGGYTAQFTLTATNGGSNPGDSDTTVTPVGITIAASTPTAAVPTKTRAGGGSTFYVGDDITLSTTITNPDGTNPADYTYVWTQISGRTTTLNNPTSATPTYRMPSSGAAPTTAVCSNGTGTTSPTSANCPRWSVVVTKTNTGKASAAANLAAYAATLPNRPVANAGAAQNPKVGSTVTLNGSASAQAQGHAISYAWTQTAGTAVTLSDPTAASPTFTAPNAASNLTFSLTVVDTQSPITGSGTNGNTSTASTVAITVSNYASPVASAGSNQSVTAGDPVTLDATGSSQADNHTLTYQWTQTAGPSVTLSDATATQPTFTAPNATVKFTVTVTDTQNPNSGVASTTSSEVTITVNYFAPPVADAGSNQTVHVADPVTLDASGSSQADNHNLTYQWTQTAGPSVTLSSDTAQKPTFTAPNSGTALKFTVTVTDTDNSITPNVATSAEVTITVNDYASPVASAGSNQTVAGTTEVTLDASGSSQADNHTLSYQWTQTSGTPVTLSDATVVNPTFTAPSNDGTVKFTVTVTDTQNPNSALASTTSSEVSIIVSNFAAPVASAGTDQTVKVATPVTLDASGSSQADNHVLAYHWTQTAGTPVTLTDTEAPQPSFTAPNAGTTLKFTVTVTDTENPNDDANSATDEVQINVDDYASPVASAGSNQTVNVTDPVTLDASGSSQADNHTLSYEWTQTAGTSVTLSDDTAVQPTFTAPSAGGALRFTVTVTDTQNPNAAVASTTSDEVLITVNDQGAPVADSGSSQNVKVGSSVTLDASGSSQADNHTLTYQWTQTAGPSVTLSDSTSVQPTFTAPNTPTALKFTVTVTDTQNPNPLVASATSDEVTITVSDYATPVANAGTNQTVAANAVVTLDGTGSSQADNHALTYAWTQTSGPSVSLSSSTAAQPTFSAPATASVLKFTVTVTDTTNPNTAVNFATSGEVTITVTAAPPAGPVVSVGDVTALEGNSSNRALSFRVTLSQPATSQVTVNYSVTSDTATVAMKKGTGVDATGKATGSLVFKTNAKGVTATMKAIPVQVWGDTAVEGNETFHVNITSVTGGASAGSKSVGVGTIIDDEGGSGLGVGVGDASIVEGNSGTRSLVIPVTLSDVPTANAGVSYTVTPGTAAYGKSAKVVGGDFGGKQSGTLAWTLGGTRTKNVTIPVWPDANVEGNETFTVTISSPTGVTIVRATGTGTIINDD